MGMPLGKVGLLWVGVGEGVVPVCGHHIAGVEYPHLSWLEASEVGGLWGVNTTVLI